MDWEKGVKRLALVSAVVMGVLHCVLYVVYGGGWMDSFFELIRLKRGGLSDDMLGIFIVFLIGFVPVWGVPTAFCWALRGFTEGNKAAPIVSGQNGQNPGARGPNIERLKWLPTGFRRKR